MVSYLQSGQVERKFLGSHHGGGYSGNTVCFRPAITGQGTRGAMHRLPAWLMLYRARMAASSSFFSPIPIRLSLSRILRILVLVLIITTMLSLAGDTIKQCMRSRTLAAAVMTGIGPAPGSVGKKRRVTRPVRLRRECPGSGSEKHTGQAPTVDPGRERGYDTGCRPGRGNTQKKERGAGYGFTAQTPWTLQKIRTFRIRERGLLPERAISFSGFSPGLNVIVYRKSSPMTSTHRI